MWIPKLVIEYLKISKEAVDDLRIELATVRTERDSLKVQLATTSSNFDWLRMKVNQLEFENKALIQKAYDIKLPAPELSRNPLREPLDINPFADVGDELAKKLGFQVYGNPPRDDAD